MNVMVLVILLKPCTTIRPSMFEVSSMTGPMRATGGSVWTDQYPHDLAPGWSRLINTFG